MSDRYASLCSSTRSAMSRVFFFFSSRRRHTRYWRDWSSDVCSSDLNYGNVIHLSTRDCSIQRRHQKMMEEAPAFSVPFRIQNEMGEAAVRLAKAIQYNSAGTLEFLVDKNNQYYFMEMNTRVQVEHTVTELVTGIDIIQLQIRLAAGEKLNIKQQDVAVFGHAIECRINAENPKDFLPSPGVIQQYIVPGGNGIRVDSHSYAGYEISPYYDSMIGKIIAFGVNRQEARSEEHTSELQSRQYLVCRLLLEKKNNKQYTLLLHLSTVSHV